MILSQALSVLKRKIKKLNLISKRYEIETEIIIKSKII